MANNARVFKALSNSRRLMILAMLQNGEATARTISKNLKIAQSTLSVHLKVLANLGLVATRVEHNMTYYYISKEGSESALAIARQLLKAAGNNHAGVGGPPAI